MNCLFILTAVLIEAAVASADDPGIRMEVRSLGEPVVACTPALFEVRLRLPSQAVRTIPAHAELCVVVRPVTMPPGETYGRPWRASFGFNRNFDRPEGDGAEATTRAVVTLLTDESSGDFLFPRDGEYRLAWSFEPGISQRLECASTLSVADLQPQLREHLSQLGVETARSMHRPRPGTPAFGGQQKAFCEPEARERRWYAGHAFQDIMTMTERHFGIKADSARDLTSIAKGVADGRWEHPGAAYAALAYARWHEAELRNRYVAKWAGSALAKCLREDPDYLALDHYLALAVEHSDIVLLPRALYQRAKFKYVCMKFDEAKQLIDQADKLEFCPMEYRRLFDKLANDVFHARRQGELIIQP